MKPTNSILILIVFFQSIVASADPPQPGGIPPVGDPVSIDSNIIFLFVTGILLGAYFVIKKK